jgi:diguanylate cyclase (GGDEF)-like protein
MAMSRSFAEIALALSLDYESVFFVDVQTDVYEQYAAHGNIHRLELKYAGEDFWAESRANIIGVLYPEDLKMLTASLDKEKVLAATEGGRAFSVAYRMLISERPVWYSMKIVRLNFEDVDYLVVGMSNIDEQIQQSEELRRATSKSVTYGQIALALANQYESIYRINFKTGHYREYRANAEYQELSIETEGEDFWGDCQKNLRRVVYKEDIPLVAEAFKKEVFLDELFSKGGLSFAYRLMIGDVPTYMNLTAVPSGVNHFIVAVSNIDFQVRREREFSEALGIALEKSRRDELTGIKNKNAYAEYEADLDADISQGKEPCFAVAVCDVNGLKQVNDILGHKAGDAYIRAASRVVCNVFKHSPVFRIGGDEFVAILRGSDYERRVALLADMERIVQANKDDDGPVLACGISPFDPATDKCVAQVFERADKLMYAHKKELKGLA